VTGLTDDLGGRPARLLFVHAHPDDETLATGVAIAHHVARGDDVHVLTCTLGEEGEVIPDHLAHLEGAAGDPLAAHRRQELAAAMALLGVTHHLLGAEQPEEPTPYRDSGMAGSPAAAHPRAWAGIDLQLASDAVRGEVERIRPDVVVTYDATGGYEHPDHVRTHAATCRALADAAVPARLYATLTPRSWAIEDRAWLSRHVPADQGWVVPGEGDPFPSSVVDDEHVTHHVVDPAVVPSQEAALRCWEALGCRHHGLFDFRVDPDGRPWFLEAGLYCSFAPTSVVVTMAQAAGIGLDDLLDDAVAALAAEGLTGSAACG